MRYIQTLVIFLFALACAAQAPVSTADRQLIFRDVSIIPMDSERVIEHQSVAIKNGRIVAIGPVKTAQHEKNALVIEASGKFLLPGLAEMHAHVPPTENVSAMKEVMMLFMVNGITTIRGMLGHPKHLELRQSIKEGAVLGPNFYTTGPSFNGMSVKSPQDGAEMVRKQKQAGYDYLKLHPGLTRQKFDAIASTAKEIGIPFAGHVSYGVGVWHAIESGYSSIDHLDGFIEGIVPGIERIPEPEAGLFGMNVADRADRSQIPKLMKALKTQNVWVVPTQSLAERWFHPDYSAEDFMKDPHAVYVSADTRNQWVSSKKNLESNEAYDEEKMQRFIALRRELILECQKQGVGLLLGCDAPQVFNVPGFSTHHELEYLVMAGLTPFQALQTGTVNVARYLGKKDSGFIAKGAVSDLILLDANPLNDIRNTRAISGVMRGENWLDKTFIEQELKKLEKPQ